jgi:hypothetical protein
MGRGRRCGFSERIGTLQSVIMVSETGNKPCEGKGLTSPIAAVVILGTNLWSARPTLTMCVSAAAECVELGSLVVVDGKSLTMEETS